MKEKKPPKEKPIPKLCACGSRGIIVELRGKKMVSCPNPEKCCGNYRTVWFSNKDQAVENWNSKIMK